MVAALFELAAAAADFADGGAAELGAANDERVFPQAAGLEVFDHGGEGLVRVLRVDLVGVDVGVGVPGVAFGVVNLHHPDAFFNEADGRERAAGGAAGTVEFLGRLGFLAYVEDLGGFGLHAEGGFHGLEGGFDLGVAAFAGEAHLFDLLEEVEFATLFGEFELGIVDVADELFGIEALFDFHLFRDLFSVLVLHGHFHRRGFAFRGVDL